MDRRINEIHYTYMIRILYKIEIVSTESKSIMRNISSKGNTIREMEEKSSNNKKRYENIK